MLCFNGLRFSHLTFFLDFSRSSDSPALTQDFSILGLADKIKSIVDNDFEIRLEAGDMEQYGGIWRVPPSYR